ncbi:MAG: hypothetical protein ABIJ61_06380 [bacterium]
MNRLEQLKEKLDQIVGKYESLLQERDRLKAANAQLSEELQQAQIQLKELERRQDKDDSRSREQHAGAVRRISKLVDKIERLQGEMDFS